ncbi:MAG TPA: replication factor C large subunit [Methanoregulaceae archaeon]|nr:replication factor C large subunit [Methanoregulaceae archaeon]
MDWTEKYRPSHLSEIIGNGTAVRQMLDWAMGWKRGTKPLLVYGKPGTGKTSAAYALAHDMHWETLELNASDQRTKAVIDRVAGAGSTSGSLTGAKRRLIILDEADNLQGTSDKGGAKAILDIIRDARQPVILIANDLYGIAGDIRAACEPVQFRALPARSIVPHLKSICLREHIGCGEVALKDIAGSAAGDVRAAVTMLNAASIGKDRIDETDVRTSNKDERASIFQLITAVFGRTTGDELMKISYEIDDTPDSILQWVEANLKALKEPSREAEAYQYLSRADEYIGNTYRQQYYTLWRYATASMLLGTSIAAGGKGIHEKINSPRRWQKMASSRRQKTTRTELLGKLGDLMHMSRRNVRDGYLSMVSILAEKESLSYAREFNLDTDQLTLLIHDRVKATAVMKQIAGERKDEEKREKIRVKKAALQEEKAEKKEVQEQGPEKSAETSQCPPPPEPEKVSRGRGKQSTLF